MSLDQAKRELDVKKDFYIKTLNTVYPLGLNDRLLGQGRVSNDSIDNALFLYIANSTKEKKSR